MNTVKDALAQKSGALIHVRSGDMVVEALRQMRDNRVRSVLVIDDDVLVGIVTQGDCAIKVLLPGLDAKQTPVAQVMTGNPVCVPEHMPIEEAIALMRGYQIRRLVVVNDAKKLVGILALDDLLLRLGEEQHALAGLMRAARGRRAECSGTPTGRRQP